MNIKLLISLFSFVLTCDCYKILIVFTTPMKSHNILGEAAAELLLNAGHEVTYVTPFPKESVPDKMRQVDVTYIGKIGLFDLKGYLKNDTVKPMSLRKISYFMHDVNVKAIQNENLQQLLNDPSQRFDAVIVDWLFSEIFVGLASLYDCPLIWMSTMDPHWQILRLVDEMPNPVFLGRCFLDRIVPFRFWERTQELLYQISSLFFKDIEFFSEEDAAFKRLLGPVFARKKKPLPSFNAVRYNASLVLSNSHHSIGYPVKLPPNFISIGGFFIDDKKQRLSLDLQTIMDNAKHGVILFSLGSNLKSKDMPEHLVRSLLNVFSELKQIVIWKVEEQIADLPQNVHVLKWLPQQSILAHSNCILFITHGGLLSITEAYHHGVPLIGIPVFADQFKNVNLVSKKGFAKKVDLTYNLPGDLKHAINEILHNKRYLEQAKLWSEIFHHRSVNPRKELVHWVEHVIHTRGATYLRSPALDVPLYQKMYLDLLGLVMLVLMALTFLIKNVIKLFMVRGIVHEKME